MTEIMEVTTATPPTARLIACFDGTWNNDRSNTNVSRLFRKIADETSQCPEQRRFYDEGVGTKWGERLRGGVFGIGGAHESVPASAIRGIGPHLITVDTSTAVVSPIKAS